MKQQLLSTTIKNLKTMRDYANGVVMDVLFYMNPYFHEKIINYVVNKINQVIDLYCKNNLQFSASNVSIMAHSLGSIIAYDIITNQQVNTNINNTRKKEGEDDKSASFYSNFKCPKLNFKIKNLFCLGSPIGMFESIRGKLVIKYDIT